MRFHEKDGTFELRDWEIRILRYKAFNGVNIPWRCHVVWKLSEGGFCWYKLEIYDIEYNDPSFTIERL